HRDRQVAGGGDRAQRAHARRSPRAARRRAVGDGLRARHQQGERQEGGEGLMNPRVQAILDRLRAIDLTPRQRQVLTWVGYPLFALFVASLAFYWSVPRERVKD